MLLIDEGGLLRVSSSAPPCLVKSHWWGKSINLNTQACLNELSRLRNADHDILPMFGALEVLQTPINRSLRVDCVYNATELQL